MRRPRKSQRQTKPKEKPPWVPRTELGKKVLRGEIESLDAIWKQGKVIRDEGIVEYFLEDLEERILKIGNGKRPFRWVQRMTDSGRRNKYYVVIAVGNKNGYVGIGEGVAKEYGNAIAQAVRKAKLNVIRADQGCGSWDCGCGGDHSISSVGLGKCASVQIELKPAPKGTGIQTNEITKDILELAGMKDVWSVTKGHTKTRANMAKATFSALKSLNQVKR